MLEDHIKTQLESFLARIVTPIELVASLDDSTESEKIRELITEVAQLSDKVSAREDGNFPRRPSLSVARAGEAPRIHFAGIPMGHEFTSFVLALLQTGGHPPKLEPDQIEAIKALKGPLSFKVFISLSCHNCPDVVQALNAIAALNPHAETVMIDGGLFRQEVAERDIMGVPAVFLNDEPFAQGRVEIAEILSRLDHGADARGAEKLSRLEPFDALVVGGGPAGAAAAIYAARKGIRTGLVAERFGGQILDTLSIENFISVKETEGPKLAASLEEHVRAYNVEIIRQQTAAALLPADGEGLVGVRLASGAVLKSKTVILATGARWREMGVPGESEYRARGVAFCPHCDGPLFKGKRVAVIGGGNSGVEAAIDLAGIAAHVTLIEYADELRADAVLQKKLASLPNVALLTSTQTTEVRGDGRKVTALAYRNRKNGAEEILELEGIFVQIGLMPNTLWLKDALELSGSGEIVIDARGQTSLPGVFAAGDCTTVPYKQIIVAMGEGAKASLSAFDHLIRTAK